MLSTIKYASAGDISVKDVDLNTRTVSGYFAAFDSIDSDNEYFVPGAFKKTIAEQGPAGKGRIAHLLQHDPFNPIGKVETLTEDSHGVYFESKIPDTTAGIDTIKNYDAGVYREHSVGFQWVAPKSPYAAHDEAGSDPVAIQEVKMWEGSTVTWGANENTPFTGFKGLARDRIAEQISNVQKQLRHGTLTDEGFNQLAIYLEQLKSYIATLAAEAPAPEIDQAAAIEAFKRGFNG